MTALPFLLVLRETPSSVQPRVGQRVSSGAPLQGPGPEGSLHGHQRGPVVCREDGGRRPGAVGWLTCLQARTALCAPWRLHQETGGQFTKGWQVSQATGLHMFMAVEQMNPFPLCSPVFWELSCQCEKKWHRNNYTKSCKSMQWSYRTQRGRWGNPVGSWLQENLEAAWGLPESVWVLAREWAKTWVIHSLHPVQHVAGLEPGAPNAYTDFWEMTFHKESVIMLVKVSSSKCILFFPGCL